MLAPLIAVALTANVPAAESAAWVAQLRSQFAGVRSVTATFTKTTSDQRSGTTRSYAGELRLARGNAGWVGDLLMRRTDDQWQVRYTLWNGRVYEADSVARKVVEYAPQDGDPLRFAADHTLPLLYLLADPPVRPPYTARLAGRNPFYHTHTLTLLAASGLSARHPGDGWQLAVGADQPRRRWTVVTMAVAGHLVPHHLPRLIRCEDGFGPVSDFDVTRLRLNDPAGAAAGIADPTVLPAGWRFSSMAKAWEESDRLLNEARRGKR